MGNSKVQLADGTVLMDTTGTTVSTDTLLSGYTALNRAGEVITGAVVTAPASTTTPKAAGTAAVGTEDAYSRGDHVHPAEIFVATYGTTSFNDIKAAYDAGKAIYVINGSDTASLCRAYPNASSPTTYYFMYAIGAIITVYSIYGVGNQWSWSTITTALVPNTRTINGKALSSDITLSADDIGAAPAALVYDSKTALTSLTAAQTQLTTWFEAMPNQSERVFYITFSSSATGTISFAKGTGIIVHLQKGTAAGTATFYGRAGNPASTVKISTMSYVSSAWSEFQDVATTADIDAAIGGAISGSY